MEYKWKAYSAGFSVQKSVQAKTYGKVRYANRDGYYFRNYHRNIKDGYSRLDMLMDFLSGSRSIYGFFTKAQDRSLNVGI